MPTIVDEAICVRHWDFSETSQTVSLLTRENGTLRGLAKGAKRERGRFSGGIDLLTRGQIVALTKPGRELATLTDWDLRQTWRIFRERLQINRAAFYMADVASRLVGPEDPHPPVFDALVVAFDALAVAGVRDVAWSEQRDIDDTVARFQWRVLEECGYRPGLAADSGSARGEFPPSPQPGAPSTIRYFDAGAGGVVETNESGRAWRVRRETIDLLQILADDESTDAAPPESISRGARLLAAYVRELLGHEPPTMSELFGELRTR